jgi:hypothetical protein
MAEERKEAPPWFESDTYINKINEFVPYPSEDDIKLKHNFYKKNNKFKFSRFKLNPIKNKLVFNKPSNTNIEESILMEKLKVTLNKMKNNDKSKHIIDGYKTKALNKISRSNKITKNRTIYIEFSKKQRNILLSWIDEARRVYNFTVDYYNKHKKKFNYDYTDLKLIIFKKLYGDSKKPIPYDILTDEIRMFCSNLKGNITAIKNGTKRHFEMKHKKKYNSYSLFIAKKSISKNGIFGNLLGKQPGFFDKYKIDCIHSDCRLIYDYVENKFYLKYLVYEDKKIISKKRKPVCALDPGEKVFMAYYGFTDYGMIGDDIRKIILKIETKIRQLNSKLKLNKNKKGKSIKNKKTLKKTIQRHHNKIKNIVKELHNQTALYLCRNYDTILIPKFEVSKMVRNDGKTMKDIYKENKKNILNKAIENKEDIKKTLKSYSRKSRLNKRVKYVLYQLSHYKFRQHLLNKGKEYGCDVKEVTEEYTSKLCSKCNHLSDKYKERVKECTHCHFKIQRDYNGSRHILIKNHAEYVN